MKPDSQRMTPTAQIAAIRQEYVDDEISIDQDGDVWSSHEHAQHANISILLKQIDARESALRALVAQWHKDADATPDDHEAGAIMKCAAAVERLLESEQ